MLTSIALILLLGLLFGSLFTKTKLPGLLGMILVGILLSPNALNLIDDSILSISADLRRVALVIILTRAGLSLELSDLKKVGRPAIFMCFLPACIEMLGTILLAPMLLGVTRLEAAIIGSVIAAVSPAVIVPRMIGLITPYSQRLPSPTSSSCVRTAFSSVPMFLQKSHITVPPSSICRCGHGAGSSPPWLRRPASSRPAWLRNGAGT